VHRWELGITLYRSMYHHGSTQLRGVTAVARDTSFCHFVRRIRRVFFMAYGGGLCDIYRSLSTLVASSSHSGDVWVLSSVALLKLRRVPILGAVALKL
jgi:hypothetical protein